MKKLFCAIMALMCLMACAEESLQVRFTGEEADPDAVRIEVEYEMLGEVKVGCLLLSRGEKKAETAFELLENAVSAEDCWGSETTLAALSGIIGKKDSVTLIASELYGYPDEDEPGETARQIEYYEFIIGDGVSVLVQCGYEFGYGEWTAVRVPEWDDEDPAYITGVIVNCKNWVSLRSKADTASERLAKVPLGALVTVYETVDDFSYCEYDGLYGYIMSSYISFDED